MPDFKLIQYLEQFVTEKRRQTFWEVLNQRTKHFTVAIEDIYQPHNASAVVRSCDIFGVQEVQVIENKYTFQATNQVAKGAQKWLDFKMFNEKGCNNTKACMNHLKKQGYAIIATTPHTDSCLLEDFDISQKSAFFFGVEKEGLSKEVMDNADQHLKIPMVGFTESLNISVAAAIILHDLTSKLKKSTVDWELSEVEKQAKYLEWLETSIKSIDRIKEHYFSSISQSK